mmetsp:Transcript_24338/g.46616  ORF Transcript_24338/g.46616 Transcript_24338/m.46616 type:complete len:112 (-) Transcript_24338:145-480(-)
MMMIPMAAQPHSLSATTHPCPQQEVIYYITLLHSKMIMSVECFPGDSLFSLSLFHRAHHECSNPINHNKRRSIARKRKSHHHRRGGRVISLNAQSTVRKIHPPMKTMATLQ